MGTRVYHSTCRLCGKARTSSVPGRGVCSACAHAAAKCEAQEQESNRPNQEQGEPEERVEGENTEAD